MLCPQVTNTSINADSDYHAHPLLRDQDITTYVFISLLLALTPKQTSLTLIQGPDLLSMESFYSPGELRPVTRIPRKLTWLMK